MSKAEPDRGLLRVALVALALVGAAAACDTDDDPDGVVPDEVGAVADVAAAPEDAAVMPDLVGATLNELGDETGVLYELHDRIGIQETLHLPSDAAPEGVVIDQDPAPGTPLDDVTGWTLTVSAGGPVVAFADLPSGVASFASTLAGLDDESLFVEKETDLGIVYKHDDWLFGLDCDAVNAAYRTFSDARYDSACPDP